MSSLDDRLSRAFRSIDVAPDFDARLLARLRDAKADGAVERAAAARQRELDAREIAGRNLRHWRRTAIRMLSLDALGAGTLLVVLLTVLPRALARVTTYGAGSLLTALIALIAVLFAVRLLSFAPARDNGAHR